MNITTTHIAYFLVFIIGTALGWIKFGLINKHTHITRIENFTYKVLSLSIIGNVFFILPCAWWQGNEDMLRIVLVFLIAFLIDINYYQWCKRRAARYRDATHHDITNDIRLK